MSRVISITSVNPRRSTLCQTVPVVSTARWVWRRNSTDECNASRCRCTHCQAVSVVSTARCFGEETALTSAMRRDTGVLTARRCRWSPQPAGRGRSLPAPIPRRTRRAAGGRRLGWPPPPGTPSCSEMMDDVISLPCKDSSCAPLPEGRAAQRAADGQAGRHRLVHRLAAYRQMHEYLVMLFLNN